MKSGSYRTQRSGATHRSSPDPVARRTTRRPPRQARGSPALAVSDSDAGPHAGAGPGAAGPRAGDEFAEGIFERCGVERRHLNLRRRLPRPHAAGPRARDRAGAAGALDQSGRRARARPGTIGTVISASLYSLGGPTLAHRLVEHYGMDPSTDKYHLTGVGCASGVPLMRLAAQRMREHPDKHALVVAAESMSSILMRATGGPQGEDRRLGDLRRRLRGRAAVRRPARRRTR